MSAAGGANINISNKSDPSTTSIPMQPMHSRDYGTMDDQQHPSPYPQYAPTAPSSSDSSSPTYDVSRPGSSRRRTPDGRSSRHAISMWDVLLLPVTVPLAIPRLIVDMSFRAFVFGLVCGVTLVRVGTAAFGSLVLGRRDVRRPRWR